MKIRRQRCIHCAAVLLGSTMPLTGPSDGVPVLCCGNCGEFMGLERGEIRPLSSAEASAVEHQLNLTTDRARFWREYVRRLRGRMEV